MHKKTKWLITVEEQENGTEDIVDEEIFVEPVNRNPNGWTDNLVKQFARVYCGNLDYWEYIECNTIDKKLEKFKNNKEMGD